MSYYIFPGMFDKADKKKFEAQTGSDNDGEGKAGLGALSK
jgi:hypothetical protein